MYRLKFTLRFEDEDRNRMEVENISRAFLQKDSVLNYLEMLQQTDHLLGAHIEVFVQNIGWVVDE